MILPSGSVARLVLVSSVLGAIVGALSPRPLYSVEIAQVVSGQVVLPAFSPMAIHHGQVFSLVVDAAAILLWAGLDAETVCRLFTMFMGALAFAAVSLTGFAFTRNHMVAGVLPFAMFGYSLGSEAHRYEFVMPLTSHDLGANGLTAALAALSLTALRSPWGALALGVLPGIHIAFGLGAWLIVAAGASVDRSVRRFLLRHWRWLGAGMALVAVAWVLHQALAPAFPAGDAVDPALVRGLQRYWDQHRAPIGANRWEFLSMFTTDGVFILLAIAAVRSGFARRRGVVFWLIGGLIVAVPALANSVLDEISPGALPLPVSALMMSRWLHLNTVGLPALALGLTLYPLTAQTRRRFATTGIGAALIVAASAPFAVAALSGTYPIRSEVFFRDEQHALQPAREGTGVLLSATPLTFPQLHTGRPQLLDLQLLDVLPYAPRAGVAMETILRDVFGASLLEPQPRDEQIAGLEARWVARRTDEWRAIGSRYGVTQVMVPGPWRSLALPMIATSEKLTLYSIPAP
jgi:hypothetical protein